MELPIFDSLLPWISQSFSNWSIILLLIGCCSLLTMTIFIERILYLKRSEIDTNSFIIELRDIIVQGDIIRAIAHCEQTGGTIATILRSGLCRHNRNRSEIETSMEVSAMMEIAKLEKNAKILSIIAHIAPLIGLLGTVLGFIQVFGEMKISGMVDISATKIGEAMEYALVTTAAGLAVAIPSIIAYNYLVSRVETFVLEIQTTSNEIVDLLMYRDNPFPKN